MSASAYVVLPHTARVGSIGDVVGLLLGSPRDTSANLPFENWHARGVSWWPAGSVPTLMTLALRNADPAIYPFRTFGDFHWELWGPHGPGRGFSLAVYPLQIAVGLHLVAFFGGHLMYNDTEAETFDEFVPNQWGNLGNDDQYRRMQAKLATVRPIGPQDLAEAEARLRDRSKRGRPLVYTGATTESGLVGLSSGVVRGEP